MNKWSILSVIVMLMVGVLSFFLGTRYGQETCQPEIIIVPDIQFVDRYIPQPELRWFESEGELDLWLKKNTALLVITFDSGQPVAFSKQDYAEDIMLKALRDGYLLPMERGVFEGEEQVWNSTIVGDRVYLVNPRTGEKTYLYDRGP